MAIHETAARGAATASGSIDQAIETAARRGVAAATDGDGPGVDRGAARQAVVEALNERVGGQTNRYVGQALERTSERLAEETRYGPVSV